MGQVAIMTAASDNLTIRWLNDAQTLRRYGDESHAILLERCVEDLEIDRRQSDLEALTLTQASRECGYTADHLRRLKRDGKLTDVGKPNAPRVRRGDLPQKPNKFDRTVLAAEFGDTSKEQIARSIVADGGIR
jgi:hypothetical protein